MDAATILVIVLIAGAIPLLVWFEVNSRRNAARKKQSASAAPADSSGGAREPAETDQAGVDKTKAA